MQKQTVFIIHTTYQAFLVIKLIKDVIKEAFDSITIIDCRKNGPSFNNITDTQCFKVLKYQSSFKYFKQVKSARSEVNNFITNIGDIKTLYIFNDIFQFDATFAKSIKKTKGKVIFVEEGVAPYHRIKFFSKKYLAGIIKSSISLLFGLRFSFKFGYSPYLDELMLSNTTLFSVNHPRFRKSLVQLDNDIGTLTATLRCQKKIELKEAASNVMYPAFLYLGQPLSEVNFISINSELAVIEKMRGICKQFGVNFYVKPHPAEEITKYKSQEILVSDLPAELLISTLQKEKLILASCFSSVNFNLIDKGISENIYMHNLFGLGFNALNFPVKAISDYNNLEAIVQNQSCRSYSKSFHRTC